ncbi:sulfite exporter TauE/SafE family protein [Colwellia asteriadis]|uniref:Sulfite exporter TauE/SafE family protein n=1 Tax=Colwellia asteriadis TaxID=517723 RepID=A0ABN1L8T7_9GAMM
MLTDLLSAFIVGLLGSGHCLAMCGGITTMLTSATEKPKQQGDIAITEQQTYPTKSSNNTSLIFSYHIGRIASYTLIGAIVGFSGSLAAKSIGVPLGGLRMVAAIFLILLGLYLGQWLMWLNRVEALGKYLWRYLSPLAKYVIPVNSTKQALGLGALWGWLPCGLVYSTLTWSLASGSSLTGAGIMLFFGLGTLPALIALSLGINSFKSLLLNANFKKTMAISLILYGCYSLTVAYQLMF